MERIENEAEVIIMIRELKRLSEHIKTYSMGAYPVYYLQLKTALKVAEILELRLRDIYQIVNGNIVVKEYIDVEGVILKFDDEDKIVFATYILHRTPIHIGSQVEILDDYLCVNRQGKQLTNQVYRKMLERACFELDLKHNYNTVYLRSLYGYLQLAYGKKTIPALMKEYHCSKYYLMNQIFKGFDVGFCSSVIVKAAGIEVSVGKEKK